MDGKFTLATLGHKESKRLRDKETEAGARLDGKFTLATLGHKETKSLRD